MPYKPITSQRPCDNCHTSFQSTSHDGGKTWRRFCSKECANADFRRPLADRFWEKVDKSGDCWIWMAARNKGGYGQFSMLVRGKGQMRKAHRVSYELAFGSVPPEMDVCHDCDNPACVNPAHLFLGTHTDNMQDKMAKGRHVPGGPPNGEQNHMAKLTSGKVREIRGLYAAGGTSYMKLGQLFGVSASTISEIVKREIWCHVE